MPADRGYRQPAALRRGLGQVVSDFDPCPQRHSGVSRPAFASIEAIAVASLDGKGVALRTAASANRCR